MTEKRNDDPCRPGRPSLDELARAKGLKPVESLDDLERFALDLWDSDEDVDAFLADVRSSRNTGVA